MKIFNNNNSYKYYFDSDLLILDNISEVFKLFENSNYDFIGATSFTEYNGPWDKKKEINTGFFGISPKINISKINLIELHRSFAIKNLYNSDQKVLNKYLELQ